MRQARLFIQVSAAALLLYAGDAFATAGSVGDIDQSGSLVGRWICTERLPDGREVVTDATLSADSRFAGVSTLAGQVVWTYSGTWKRDGEQLTWNYEKSSQPMPESMKTDVDRILALNPGALVLLSTRSGLQHTFLRHD